MKRRRNASWPIALNGIPQKGQPVRIIGRLWLASLWSTSLYSCVDQESYIAVLFSLASSVYARANLGAFFMPWSRIQMSQKSNILLNRRSTARSTARLYKANAATLRTTFDLGQVIASFIRLAFWQMAFH